ncbi:uncharacterized protein BHQ10_004414 [Talaromyces amestolkiae]|uniref:Transcription factor domain-containing protein n=1 Tax=Talaromyces amestolkiae TaxID=1196081 RepID=A0A364KXX2_TALAM|nr:uncharacterized protein BHQ10_004414 [Talaromyces amestolkiae]RAO68402.1 hypothetical protein BHQ10_004414 [Talaromyces amestolkiae]
MRMTSQTFYGLSMHWARYCGMFESATKDDIQLPHESDPLERKTHYWKLWVGKESQLRILLGLYIIDGVVSQYSGNGFGTPWPSISTLPLPASDAAFNATSPDKWLLSIGDIDRQRRTDSLNDLCYRFFAPQNRDHDDQFTIILEQELELFNTKIALETMYCLATASNRTERPPVGIPSKLDVSRALSLLRWHSICLDTIKSTANGARRMCYQFGLTQHIFGGLTRQETGINPHRWIQGPNARKCVAQDVYLPGGLFAAATTYSSFALASTLKIAIPSSVDWDVVLLSGFDGYSLPSTGAVGVTESARGTAMFIQGVLSPLDGECEVHNLLYDLTSIKTLLRAMSVHWGVAREMEEVIDAWTQRFV